MADTSKNHSRYHDQSKSTVRKPEHTKAPRPLENAKNNDWTCTYSTIPSRNQSVTSCRRPFAVASPRSGRDQGNARYPASRAGPRLGGAGASVSQQLHQPSRVRTLTRGSRAGERAVRGAQCRVASRTSSATLAGSTLSSRPSRLL